jgi:hypothetical protein
MMITWAGRPAVTRECFHMNLLPVPLLFDVTVDKRCCVNLNCVQWQNLRKCRRKVIDVNDI